MNAIEEVRQIGYSVWRRLLAPREVVHVTRRVESYLAVDHPGIVRERDGVTVRALHGMHLYDPFFEAMFSDGRFIRAAEEFLQDRCYIHQSKINLKRKQVGAAWPWHQDFIFWSRADGIPQPRLLNVAVLLDEATMQNGPMCLVQRSHRLGELTDIEYPSSQWHGNVSEDLTYQISPGRLEQIICENGVEHFTGDAGDGLLFDPMVPHSSARNTSDKNRSILIVTYNALSNAPVASGATPRPEFLCASDRAPLEAGCPAWTLREDQ